MSSAFQRPAAKVSASTEPLPGRVAAGCHQRYCTDTRQQQSGGSDSQRSPARAKSPNPCTVSTVQPNSEAASSGSLPVSSQQESKWSDTRRTLNHEKKKESCLIRRIRLPKRFSRSTCRVCVQPYTKPAAGNTG